ncbi:MAG: heavy-metal-associated domain-containing protein [Leptospirillum sp.]
MFGWLFVLLSAMFIVLSGSLSGWAASPGSLETVTLFVPGVVFARGDLKTKTETVTIQSNRVAIRSLEQATKDAGYPTSVSSLAKDFLEPGAAVFPNDRAFFEETSACESPI